MNPDAKTTFGQIVKDYGVHQGTTSKWLRTAEVLSATPRPDRQNYANYAVERACSNERRMFAMNENPLGLIAAILLLIGAVSGAVAASSMYWSDESKVSIFLAAYARPGNKRKESVKAEAARTQIEKREEWRDAFSLWGWSLVIAGSAFALLALIL